MGPMWAQSTLVARVLRAKVNKHIPPNKIITISAKQLIQKNKRRNIMVKLLNQEVKIDLIQSCRSVKPTGLYVRENLTPTRSSIHYILRQVKKRTGRIDYCGTMNGKVFIWMKPREGVQGNNRKIFISNMFTLRRLCNEELGVDPAEFIDRERQ